MRNRRVTAAGRKVDSDAEVLTDREQIEPSS